MEIRFSYPQMTSEQYVETIHLFNMDIEKENLRTLIPRLTVFAFYALMLILWGLILTRFFFWILRAITAKEIFVIGMSLIFYVIGVFLSYGILLFLLKKLRPVLLSVARAKDRVESYSFSEYVERSDSEKKAGDELIFYQMCDILKRSKVLDASAVCDGTLCKVEVAFENEDARHIFTFYLPYRESASAKCVTVDFSRKCVLFPPQEEQPT